MLYYGGTAGIKSFVIDHPLDENKYLVHACLEGPESGVYYRGTSEITNHHYTTIILPSYVDVLAADFTVQITHIYDGSIKTFSVSEVKQNMFSVFGPNGRFNWIVHGKRETIETEPLKSTTDVRGDGPYRWIP